MCCAQAPAPKAAPAPKKAAKKGAAPAPAGMGFSGVPADFARPVVNCPSGYPAEADAQTVRAPPISYPVHLRNSSAACEAEWSS